MGLARSRGSPFLALLPAFLVCLAGCPAGLAGGDPARKAGGGTQPKEIPPRVVRVVRPEPVSLDETYPSNLYVEKDVRITARRSGVIEQVLAERGDRVTAGQPLALLESDLATHELEMAAEDLRLAQADYDRSRSLHDQKIVSQQDFLRAEIALDRAQSKAEVARAWLERCTVRSPFDGVVVERWAVAGQRVQEEDGTPLFRIVARERLRARVDVPESCLAALAPGTRAMLEIPGDAAFYPARVLFVSPAIDAGSGTAPVIVETTSNGGALRLGASVRVRFQGAARPEAVALRIPREALPGGSARLDRKATVLVAEGLRAAARRVQVVEIRGTSLMVRGELVASDRVIVGAGPGLAEGDSVVASEGAP